MGGHLRLRFRLCRRIRSAAFSSPTTRSDPAAPTSSRSLQCIRLLCSSPTAPRALRSRKRADSARSAPGTAPSRSHRRCRFTSTMPTTARRTRRFMSRVNNALAKLADGTSSWLMAVNGADAYVSPDWYVSPDQVPTWLYQAVHLTGTVRTIVRRRTRPASRRAQRQIRKLAGAEAALDCRRR